MYMHMYMYVHVDVWRALSVVMAVVIVHVGVICVSVVIGQLLLHCSTNPCLCNMYMYV